MPENIINPLRKGLWFSLLSQSSVWKYQNVPWPFKYKTVKLNLVIAVKTIESLSKILSDPHIAFKIIYLILVTYFDEYSFLSDQSLCWEIQNISVTHFYWKSGNIFLKSLNPSIPEILRIPYICHDWSRPLGRKFFIYLTE